MAKKVIDNKGLCIEARSDWSALFVYDKGKIKGLYAGKNKIKYFIIE